MGVIYGMGTICTADWQKWFGGGVPLKTYMLLKNEGTLDLSQHGIPFFFPNATF